MDWFAWGLALVVIVYAGLYVIKAFTPLWRYNKLKDMVVEIPGKIVDLTNEEKKAFDGQMVITSYPLYECEINGKTRVIQSTVRYKNAFLGQDIILYYNKDSDELWAKNDLPLIKKQMMFRLGVLLIVTLLMILESILI